MMLIKLLAPDSMYVKNWSNLSIEGCANYPGLTYTKPSGLRVSGRVRQLSPQRVTGVPILPTPTPGVPTINITGGTDPGLWHTLLVRVHL